MRIARWVFLAMASVSLLVPAQAWNGRGHMIVAAAAWKDMTPTAQAAVGTLLKSNPFYERWVADVAPEEQDRIAFVIAATWPDAIKKWRGSCPDDVLPNSGPLSDYTYCSDGEKPSHEGADANTGYTDRLEHKYWHYIDLPFSDDGTPLTQPEPPNAQSEIERFRTTLASPEAGGDLKSYDLVWLEHLVGDVHQPLHATSRFSAAFPDGDQGGNLVCTGTALTVRKDWKTGEEKEVCKSELHAFWDALLGKQRAKASDAANARLAIAAADTLGPADAAKLADEEVGHWIADSAALAKSAAYAAPVGAERGPYDIEHDPAYKQTARDVARTQAALAGARLAKLLNAAFR